MCASRHSQWEWSSIPKVPKIASSAMSLQYLKKEVRDKVDFLRADKHKSFLQVDFKFLSIKSVLQGDPIDGHDQAFSKYSR